MAIELTILGELVDGVLDDTLGLDGVWYLGHTYQIQVTGAVSTLDYLYDTDFSGDGVRGYHIVKDTDIRFNKLVSRYGVNQPFQSLAAVNESYDYTVSEDSTFSNLNDIVTDWSGDRVALITYMSGAIIDTDDYGKVKFSEDTYHALWPNPPYYHYAVRRIRQTITRTYSLKIYKEPPDSYQGNLGDYYLAAWEYTTPWGETDEADGVDGALIAWYEATLDADLVPYGDNYHNYGLTPTVYFNYVPSDLQTLKITVTYDPAIDLPEKAVLVSPAPTGVTDVDGDAGLEWLDGGLGAANAATGFDLYFAGTEAGLTKIGDSLGSGTVTATPETVNEGNYSAGETYYWRVDSFNAGGLTTGDVWSYTVFSLEFPETRPVDYDEDGASTLGGGRYGRQLMVLGHRRIYFGAL